MIWFTARMAESNAYLLFDPQPPMKRPTISSAETARKKRTPMFRSASPSPGAKGAEHGIRPGSPRPTPGPPDPVGAPAPALLGRGRRGGGAAGWERGPPRHFMR